VKLQPISKSAGFNHEAAERARAWVLEDPDYAMAVLPFVLHEGVQSMIFDNQGVIQKALDIALEPQVSAISKALGDNYWDRRNERGEFAHVESRRKRPIRYGKQGRYPHKTNLPRVGGLTAHQQDRYEQALEQVADEIDAAINSGHDPADAFWTAMWEDKTGRVSATRGVGLSPASIASGENFKDDGRLIEIGITSKPTLQSAAGAGYDLMTGMSNAHTAEAIGGGLRRVGMELDDPVRVKTYIDAVNGQTGRKKTTALFDRMRASGELATAVMGDSAPGKLKLAAAVATYVGTHGPEAEKVLGPPTQRAAYRYRGVEKKPDPRLQGTIDDSIRAATKQLEKEGLPQSVVNTRARQAVLYGWTKTIAPKRPGMPVKTEHRESELIQYFQGRLPSPDLYRLQRKSGTLPPSQGVIIDRHGRVAHEAVGYGEDWYLPFNLKNLKALKGGEYVRTRAYGGLTTEDIYTGLVSGARSVTVVSNSGIFTLEFDDNFRGGRRLNDKAARMVSRYGHLLDAIENGQVDIGGLDPSLKAEIKVKAARTYDPVANPNGYEREVAEQETRARMNPRLSEKQRAAIATEVTDEAARDYAARAGYDVDNLADVVEHESQAIRAKWSSYVEGQPRGLKEVTPAMARERADAEISEKWGAGGPARTLGIEAKIKAAEEAALEEQIHRTSTLKLDGEGFKYAGDALKEQFPYYIGDFQARNLGTRPDAGYVKLGGLRPKTGLDPNAPRSPQGSGARDVRDTARQPAAAEGAGEAPKAAAVVEPVTRSAQAEEREAIFAAADAFRAGAGKIGPRATGPLGQYVLEDNRGAQGPAVDAFFKEHFGNLIDPNFRSRYLREPEFAARAKDQLRVAHDKRVLDIDLGPALGQRSKPLAEWDEVAALDGNPEDFDFGESFAADAGGSDPTVAKEHFFGLLDQDQDIRQVLSREDLDADNIPQLVRAIPVIRVQKVHQLRQWLAAERNHADAKGAAKDRYPEPSQDEFERLTDDLYGLDKAHVALKYAREAEQREGAAKVVPGSAGPQNVEEKLLVVADAGDAGKAVDRVIAGGSEAQVGGELSPEQVAAWQRRGGIVP